MYEKRVFFGGGVMNQVLIQHILELSETKTRFQRIKRSMSDWRKVVMVVIVTITIKVMIEQLWMAIR